MRVKLTLLMLLLVTAPALAQDATNADDPLALQPVFSDDFSTDSRKNYLIKGDVGWKKGRLEFPTGSSIGRAIKAGSRVEAKLNLKFEPLTKDGQQSNTFWQLNMGDASDCIVNWFMTRQKGKTVGRVRIMVTVPKEDQFRLQLVRGVVVTADQMSGEWSVNYRNGLIQIDHGRQPLVSGFIANGTAAVKGLRLIQQVDGSAQVTSLTIFASAAPKPLTEDQHNQLARATKLFIDVSQLYQRGQSAKAIVPARQALEIRRSILTEDHPDYAACLIGLAVLYDSMGEYGKAEPLYIQARYIHKKVLGEQHPSYALILNKLALLYRSSGEYAKAEPLFLEARDITKKILGEQHPNYVTSLNNLAALYHSMDEYAKAEPLYLEARDIDKETLGKQHPSYAVSLNNLAALYVSMGEYAKAEPFYLEARDIFKKVLGVQHPSYASSINNLAALYKSLGAYAKAEPLFLQAHEIKKRVLGDQHADYASSLDNLAEMYKSMGEYAKAEPLNLETLGIRKNVLGEQHPDYARSLNNLAELYDSMGEYGKAEPLYIRARDIRKKVLGEQHPDFAQSLNNLASLYKSRGEYAKAEPLFLEALEITKRSLGEQHPNYAACLNNLAGLYKLNSEYAKVEPLYLQALDIAKKVQSEQHPDYAICLFNLSGLYGSMGEHAQAEPLLLQAHDIFKKVLGEQHPSYATSLTSLAGLYLLIGENAKAELRCREAWQVRQTHVSTLLPTMSEAQAQAFLNEHRPDTDKVLSIAHLRNNANPSALYNYVWQSRALATRHIRRVETEFNPASKAYTVQWNLLQSRRLLARLVVARPPKGKLKGFQAEIAKANAEKERLEKELASLSQETSAFIRVRDAKVEQLVQSLPAKSCLLDILKTDYWERTATERDGKAVDKFVPHWEYYAFIIKPKPKGEYTVAWVHLGPVEPIDEEVSKWRAALIASSSEPPTELKRAVWDKIARHLGDVKQIIVVPDGRLSQIPWGALPGNKPGSYLIEEYAISTVGFGQQLYGLLASKPVQSKGLVLAGGIDYSQPSQSGSSASSGNGKKPLIAGLRRAALPKGQTQVWKKLPGTVKETRRIESLFRKDTAQQTVIFSGRKANERELARAMSGVRYVHLATHGFFAAPGIKSIFDFEPRAQSLFGSSAQQQRSSTVGGRNPLLLSGIVLAGANLGAKKDRLGLPTGEDDILTAEEVAGLKLRDTELVVLSACETGLGDVANGEGVFGLQRAFHLAGARTVIGSMWKVDDNATQALMVEFYRNLWEKKLGKLEALRQAQLTMIKGYDAKSGEVRGLGSKPVPLVSSKEKPKQLPPFYWAAFQLSGDWR